MIMLRTRRGFLQSAAAAATLSAGTMPSAAQGQRGTRQIESIPDSEIKMPKVKFGDLEVSR